MSTERCKTNLTEASPLSRPLRTLAASLYCPVTDGLFGVQIIPLRTVRSE